MNFMRAQVTAEFSIILVYVILVFSMILFISLSGEKVLESTKNNYEASVLATKLSNNINNVFLAGDGARLNVSIALTSDYNITLHDRYLSVQKSSETIERALVTNSTNFSAITTSRFVIKNLNGVIHIE